MLLELAYGFVTEMKKIASGKLCTGISMCWVFPLPGADARHSVVCLIKDEVVQPIKDFPLPNSLSSDFYCRNNRVRHPKQSSKQQP